LQRIPIGFAGGAATTDKFDHESIVKMVGSMLNLHKELTAAKTDQEKIVIRRQIDATDKQIDARVYELYGLTEEEIRIVEGSNLLPRL
jgi:hypothetical protein